MVVVAMALWGHAVSRLGPKVAMVYVYLEHVSAVAIARLGESFSGRQGLGAVLAFAAVWIVSAPRRTS